MNKFTDNHGIAKRSEEFLALFLAHQNRVYSYILTMVPNRVDADDILQETTMVMWREYCKETEVKNFAAWAIKISQYRIMNYRNSQIRSRMKYSSKLMTMLSDEVAIKYDSYDDRLDSLDNCLNKLGQKDRRLVRMRYEDNCKANEISTKVGMSVHGIYKALSRINNALLHCVRRRMKLEGAND